MNLKWIVLGSVFLLGACQSTGGYKPVSDTLPQLGVKFASGEWTGGKVPADGVCARFGGKGASPELVVTGIPAGADAVIVEYSDRSYAQNNFGGHGKIGYPVTAPGTATLASVPGTSKTLPGGAWVERGNNDTGVGYLGPCSGGRANLYEADVLAVKKPAKEGEPGQLLAKGHIRLGTY